LWELSWILATGRIQSYGTVEASLRREIAALAVPR
jgi:hypothetical protein